MAKLGSDWVYIGLGAAAIYAVYKWSNTTAKTAETLGGQATQFTGAASNLGTDVIQTAQGLFDGVKDFFANLKLPSGGTTTNNYTSYMGPDTLANTAAYGGTLFKPNGTQVPKIDLNTGLINADLTSPGSLPANLTRINLTSAGSLPSNLVRVNLNPLFKEPVNVNTGLPYSSTAKVYQNNVPSTNTISIFNKITGQTRIVPAVQGA